MHGRFSHPTWLWHHHGRTHGCYLLLRLHAIICRRKITLDQEPRTYQQRTKNQGHVSTLYSNPLQRMDACMHGCYLLLFILSLLTSFIFILVSYSIYLTHRFTYTMQFIYTNKNLLYTAGASRMVCKSAYLGPCSYIGPKRPIKNKKLFRVYGKVLYTEHRLSAHSYLVYIWYVFHTQNTYSPNGACTEGVLADEIRYPKKGLTQVAHSFRSEKKTTLGDTCSRLV